MIEERHPSFELEGGNFQNSRGYMGHLLVKYTSEAFKWCSGILIGITVILNFIAVIMRYMLNNPIMWCEEISLLLFVSSISFAIVPMTYNRRAVRLDFFVDLLSQRIQSICQVIVQVISGFALGVVALLGVSLMLRTKYRFTPILKIPFRYIYAVTVLGMAVAAIIFIYHAVEDIKKLHKTSLEKLK